MKRLIALLMLVPVVSLGATITIDNIPTDATPNLVAQCEELRKSLARSPTEWNNGAQPLSNCAKEFIRIGSREFTKSSSRTLRNQQAADLVDTDMATYDTNFPRPSQAFCGNSVVDNFDNFNEQCDDGGESAACNATCTFSVCGDSALNVTDGEQCDDGNLLNGDGCDATCQIEVP